MKIAILVREETAMKCTGRGCLRSFFAREESFAVYKGMENVELIGFFHSANLDHKINRMKEAGAQVIHVSTCMRGKYEGYEELVKKLSANFDVIGYTHGSENGKNQNTVSITGKYLAAKYTTKPAAKETAIFSLGR